MFKIPKEAEGRRLDILLQNIPTLNVKVSKVTDDEIIAVHDDSEEVHINQSFVMCWWYSMKKEISPERREALKNARAHKKSM